MRWLMELGVALVVTVVVRQVALATRFVARPHHLVTAHDKPIALLGGAAVCVSWLLLLGLPWEAGGSGWRVGCAVAITAVGMWDDKRPLTPYQKLALQFVISGVYLVATAGVHAGTVLEWLVLVFVMNAVNVLDIMDGLLLTSTLLGAVGLGLVPGWLGPGTAAEIGTFVVALVALWCFNCPPARIFSGDAGSLLCGFLLTAWWLELGRGEPLRAAAGLGVLAVPLFEVSLVIAARRSRGLTLLVATPDNFSLRLQDRLGWTRWEVLGATAAAGGLLALAPWVAEHAARGWFAGYAVAAVVLFGVLWWRVWKIPPVLADERAARAADGAE
ncbi:MAG: undecaprenyl/decaprenyl-phosphate alpha-N-acetylglucosaminyl 1-phosphate transferase [Armatimonadetes bacterium]|nr:undecaprenyl/decaprenyl-phosphate alpha-N-acetylglucosaminyl 1-phosphate transferase [Armatimonadota bacterium]